MDPNFATPFIFVAHATIRADLCLASPPLPLALAARPPSSAVFALLLFKSDGEKVRGSGKIKLRVGLLHRAISTLPPRGGQEIRSAQSRRLGFRSG